MGIPKEYLHRVTERFFTVDPSKSRSDHQTGRFWKRNESERSEARQERNRNELNQKYASFKKNCESNRGPEDEIRFTANRCKLEQI